jgi:hypothetical protein
MEFAPLERRPESANPQLSQGLTPQDSSETPMLPENRIDYSQIPPAFQRSFSLGELPTSPPERMQGQPDGMAPAPAGKGVSAFGLDAKAKANAKVNQTSKLIAAVPSIDEKNTRPAKTDLTQQPLASGSSGSTSTETSKSQSGLAQGTELIAANTRFRPPNGPDRACFDLLEIIEQLARELKNRFDDMLSDQHGLYIAMKTQQEHKLPKNVGTWEGHKTKYRNVQAELRRKLKEFRDNDHCDDDDPYGYGFSESYALAEEYVGKAPPEMPSNVSLETAPNWVLETIQNLGGQIVDGVIIVAKGIGGAALFLLILFAKILSAPFERQV